MLNFKVLAQDWKQLLYLLSTPSWFCSLHWLVRSQNSHSLTRETAQPTKFNKSLCYKHYKYIVKLNIFCFGKCSAWNTLRIWIYFYYFTELFNILSGITWRIRHTLYIHSSIDRVCYIIVCRVLLPNPPGQRCLHRICFGGRK